MKYTIIVDRNKINSLYNQIEAMKGTSFDKTLLENLKVMDKKLILYKDDPDDSSFVRYPQTILSCFVELLYKKRVDESTEAGKMLAKNLLSLHQDEKFQTTDDFFEAHKNIEGFWEELLDAGLYYFAAEKIENNKKLKELISIYIEKNETNKHLFFQKFYNSKGLSTTYFVNTYGITGTLFGNAYKFFLSYDLLDLIDENESDLVNEYQVRYLDFFIEEKIQSIKSSSLLNVDEVEVCQDNIIKLQRYGFKTRFQYLLEELEGNKIDIFSSLLDTYSKEAYEYGIFMNLYKLIFCAMIPSDDKYLRKIFCRLSEKNINIFNKEIVIEEPFRGTKTIAENFLCGLSDDEPNEVNQSLQDLKEYLGRQITFSNEALSYAVEKTSILSREFIKKYGSSVGVEKAILDNFSKNNWSFLLKDIFLSDVNDKKSLEIGLNLFKNGLSKGFIFLNNDYETIYHDLTYYKEYLAENDAEREASYKFELLYYDHLMSLENKEFLKLLRFIDYNGKTLLHNTAVNQDIKFLKRLLENIKDRKYSKLDQVFNIKDHHSRVFYEYLESEKDSEIIKGFLGIKNDNENTKKQRGNYEFLFSASLFDTILNLLNIESEEIIKHTSLRTLSNLNISKVMDEELKAMGSSDLLEKNTINLKSIMKLTDNVDDSSERALRKYLNNLLGSEAYKVLNVVQRLGYSIIKNNSKSEDIIHIFSRLNNDKYLTKIVSVVVNIIFPMVSKNIYFDNEFKTYKIKSDDNSEGINFIKKEEIINTFTKLIYIDTGSIRNDGFITLNNSYDLKFEMMLSKKEEDLLGLLSQISKIFYGEDIVKLLKDLRKILINNTKLYEYESKYRNEKNIFRRLEENIAIDYNLKTATLNYNSKISEADFVFLKSKGYTIK